MSTRRRISMILLLGFHDGLEQPGQAAPRWRASLEWAVGESPDGAVFSFIGDVAIDARGMAYVLDQESPFVRVISAQGTQVRTFGRLGGGPGEYRQPFRLGWKGDTLWVVDPPQFRISLVDRGGGVRSFAVRGSLGPPFVGAVVVGLFGDGGLLAAGRPPATSGTETVVEYIPLLRLSREGASTDAIAMLSSVHMQVRIPVRVQGQVGRAYVEEPFGDAPPWRLTKDGPAVVIVHRPAPTRGSTAEFTVLSLTPLGDTNFVRRVAYAPRRLNDDVFEREAARALDLSRFSVKPVVNLAEVGPLLYRPEFLAPVGALATARDGTIWLRREPVADRDSVEYLVMDHTGATKGVVTLPVSVAVVDSDGRGLWATGRSDDGAHLLLKYRITRD